MGYGISNVWPEWVMSIAKRVKIAEAGIAYAKAEYYLDKMTDTLRDSGMQHTDPGTWCEFCHLLAFHKNRRDQAQKHFFQVMREAGE